MGIISDLLNKLDQLEPALEAEDITNEVQNNTDKTMGKDVDDGGDEATAGGTDNSDGEIDTNTDDILGTSEDEQTDDDTGDEDEGATNDTAEDDMSDENSEDGSAEDTSTEESLEENDTSFEAIRKRKMHKQFISFFETVNDDIKVINEYVPLESDENTITALTNINNNLTQCKEYAYRILTEEFKNMEYPILLKKYVALNRVYDLCIRTLQTYFDLKRKNSDK